MNKNQPIMAGRCLLNVEHLNVSQVRGGFPTAGIRILQASTGGDECHYAPASDVYLSVTTVDAQRLSAAFSALARKLQGVET